MLIRGKKTQEYLYYPYGETWVVEDTTQDEITRLFTGQEYDKETGLYYYNARYYDPHIGVFMRPDPMMEGLNHYAYANWNPIRYNDPTGLSAGSAGATSSSSNSNSSGSTASCSGMAAGMGIGGPSASNTSASNASQDGMGVGIPPNWWRPNDPGQGILNTEQQKAKANKSVNYVQNQVKQNEQKYLEKYCSNKNQVTEKDVTTKVNLVDWSLIEGAVRGLCYFLHKLVYPGVEADNPFMVEAEPKEEPPFVIGIMPYFGDLVYDGKLLSTSKYIQEEIYNARYGLFYKKNTMEGLFHVTKNDIVPLNEIPLGAIYNKVYNKNGNIIGGIIIEGEVKGGAISDYINIWNGMHKK